MEFSPTEIGQSLLGLGLALKGMSGLFASKKNPAPSTCALANDKYEDIMAMLKTLVEECKETREERELLRGHLIKILTILEERK
jgi:hypothetical protein